MMKDARKKIYIKRFNNIWEFLVTTIPFILPLVLTWIFSKNEYCKWLILVICVLIFAIGFLTKHLIEIEHIIAEEKPVYPRLRTIEGNCLIFEPSENFERHSVVSIYLKQESEQFQTYGWIQDILSDTKVIQVISYEDKSKKKFKEWKQMKDKIILKPSIPFEVIDEIKEEERNKTAKEMEEKFPNKEESENAGK